MCYSSLDCRMFHAVNSRLYISTESVYVMENDLGCMLASGKRDMNYNDRVKGVLLKLGLSKLIQSLTKNDTSRTLTCGHSGRL